MPEIKLTGVKGYTSQDERHPAENLLSGKIGGGKWLVSLPRTSTSMSATFQLAECCIISSVHVGNNGSAFVSIEVSRTGSSDFKVLLPCSTLMTLQESKLGQNRSSVQMFVKDDFLEETREEKWDQLRVIVTQPFNNKTQFGLCFLSVFSYTEEDNTNTKKTSDLLSKWEKMKNESSTCSSPTNSKSPHWRISSSSPQSRSNKLLLKAGHQSKLEAKDDDAVLSGCMTEEDESLFEASVLSFMESLKLQDEDLDTLQLSDVRKKMEQVQGKQFSKLEKQILYSAVKKYVMSMKPVKPSKVSKSPYFSATNKAEQCSKKDSVKNLKTDDEINVSPFSYSVNKEQCSVQDTGGEDTRSLTAWLSTKKDPTEPSTSKDDIQTPSVRRNIVSLEDSSHVSEERVHTKEKNRKLLGGNSRIVNEDSLGISDCEILGSSKMCDSVTTPKRKFFSVEENVNKKFHKLPDNVDIYEFSDVQEVNPDSDSSSTEHLVECPICKVYFESDAIEAHCSDCVLFTENNVVEDPVILPDVTCPVCSKSMSSSVVDIHAVRCASEMFGD